MRISVVTLGSADPERARAFYERFLGETPTRDHAGVIYFPLQGAWLALHEREALARYCGVPAEGTGFGGVTLSVNVDRPQCVDDAAARAEAAGARLVRAPGPAAWGGRIAWIADPDGHLWELVYNPRALPPG
jgi:catechol 2,3-dioxygenase-like lactoylglutathione lyase family enzyme